MSYDAIYCKTKIIDVATAKFIMDEHKNFRNISKNRINFYARQMLEDKWGLSMLVFDEDQNLIDGQHRLIGVIESGIPTRFLMIYNWPTDDPKDVLNFDSGQIRTKSQVVKNALPTTTDTNIKVSIATHIMYNGRSNELISNSETVDLMRVHGDSIDEILSYGSPIIKAAAHYIPFARAILAMPERKYDILDAFSRLANLEFSDPRMNGLKVYYTTIIALGAKRFAGQSERYNIYLKCCRAIIAFLNDEKIARLIPMKEDPFDLTDEQIWNEQ